ncbi:MAG: type II toxin-antitoxin system RelE/ParE family toxin [Rhizorhabdus sp.]|uniref:type II toxin-antitoxin system RelE/ParE family toxin n=1 Tax=Rhizorhabdus sp. TaxID=1968843 RepID=UPI001B523D43|nr:type II toxin-antitoxin system RelE/ParE family toxin [Rhizorhabdus sp.]MBP8235740.1 type II toxin-antitoxin system RelE/ParE family toxin [Rhizorhabdus sp.]
MIIITVSDKRVKALVEDPTLTKVKGFNALQVRKVAEMIVAITVMTNPHQLRSVPAWRAHELKPGQPGKWSMWVTPNDRLTFHVDQDRQEVHLLDYEDYH